MELSDVWRALLRRWYLLLVGILVTVGATWFVATSVGPTYHVEGSVLLLPPEIAQERDPTADLQGNPYLFLGGLTAARDVVVKAVTSRSARDEVDVVAPGAEYEVTPDFDSSGPIFLLRVDAPTEAASLAGLEALIASIEPTLRDLQDGLRIESSAYISARVITQDVTAETVRKGQIRATIATAAAVGALVVLAIGVIDGLMGGRRRRRPEQSDSAEDAAAPESRPDLGIEPQAGPVEAPTAAPEVGHGRPGRTGRKRRRQQPAARDDDGQMDPRPENAASSAG